MVVGLDIGETMCVMEVDDELGDIRQRSGSDNCREVGFAFGMGEVKLLDATRVVTQKRDLLSETSRRGAEADLKRHLPGAGQTELQPLAVVTDVDGTPERGRVAYDVAPAPADGHERRPVRDAKTGVA